MTTYESSSLPLRNIAFSRSLAGIPHRNRPDRHNFDVFLAFTSCFGVWLLVATTLLIAVQ
ncbi:MAG: hypothetical protein AAGF11_22305 [Myxococcota bacterium]